MFSTSSFTSRRHLGDLGNAGVGEYQVELFGRQERTVLLDERVLGPREDFHKIRRRQRVELYADGEASLKLRQQIARLRDVERSGGDEEHVVRS